MKNFTKLTLFAFLSSLSLSIMPSAYKKALENAHDTFSMCQHTVSLAVQGKNTDTQASEKCSSFMTAYDKAFRAKPTDTGTRKDDVYAGLINTADSSFLLCAYHKDAEACETFIGLFRVAHAVKGASKSQ